MPTHYVNPNTSEYYAGFTPVGNTPSGEPVFTYIGDVGRSADAANGDGVGGFSVYQGDIVAPESTEAVVETPEQTPVTYSPTGGQVEQTPEPEVTEPVAETPDESIPSAVAIEAPAPEIETPEPVVEPTEPESNNV